MAETKKDSVERIEVVPGQQVQISIQSMAGSTGYSWMLTQLNGGLALTGVAMVPVTTGAIGPVNQIFQFLAIQEGTYKLVFDLIAPWRPGESGDQKCYEVNVTVPSKSAKDDIAAAMKGRDFVNAATVNLGDNPSQILKYAAPMATQTTPVVIYAAPMVMNNTMAAQTAPLVVYAAPMVMSNNIAAQTAPLVVYAAPMVMSNNIAAQTTPLVVYAAPMVMSNNIAAQTTPLVVYAAPMATSNTVAAQTSPLILYAAPMAMNMLGAAASLMPPYAAPQTAFAPQVQYLSPFVPSRGQGMIPFPGGNWGNIMATTMVAYAAPCLNSLYYQQFNSGYCC